VTSSRHAPPMTQDELLKAPNKAQDVSYVAPGVGVHT
jgi:hypothetical protein